MVLKTGRVVLKDKLPIKGDAQVVVSSLKQQQMIYWQKLLVTTGSKECLIRKQAQHLHKVQVLCMFLPAGEHFRSKPGGLRSSKVRWE